MFKKNIFPPHRGTPACYRGCAYKVFQTVQRHGVCNTLYRTVHYKVIHKDYGFLLSLYSHDCVGSDVMQYELTHPEFMRYQCGVRFLAKCLYMVFFIIILEMELGTTKRVIFVFIHFVSQNLCCEHKMHITA